MVYIVSYFSKEGAYWGGVRRAVARDLEPSALEQDLRNPDSPHPL